MTCIQALPIEVIYAGNSCGCPKNLNYEMNMPIPAESKPNIPSEYDYRVEYPLKAKATVTYSFDFDVEQPPAAPQLPAPEPKSDIFAKVDRVMALKKGEFYTTDRLQHVNIRKRKKFRCLLA